MAIASLLVRIGANDAEVQKALASVGEKARSVDADLKKLGSSPIGTGAQKSLEVLKTTIQSITDAQQRVADRATDAARGLEAMGGASRLTDSQLKQVNRTLQDGLSAYKALGTQAPLELQKIADAVKGTLDQPLGALNSKVIAIGTVLGTFIGNAAIGLGRDLLQGAKATLEYADSLENLSTATGVSVEGLQRLENIGVTANISTETLARSVEQLQKHLDDPAAARALTAMGENYQRIRTLNPEQQFLEIAQAVARIQDPVEKANAGAVLFGKTWEQIAPAIVGDIEQTATAIQGLSQEQVAALDRVGDAWDTLKLKAERYLAILVSDLVPKGPSPFIAKAIAGGVFDSSLIPSAPQAPNSPFGLRPATREGVDPSLMAELQIGGKTLEQQQKLNAELVKMQALQDQLFGRALIEHANELVRALGDADNVTKLTAGSTKKLHEDLGQAMEVYRALGRDVPLAMQAIYDKTAALQLKTVSLVNGMAIGLPQITERIQGLAAAAQGLTTINSGTIFERQNLAKGPVDVKGAAAANIAAATAGSASSKGFATDLLAGVPNAIQAAIQGGGSKLQAAGSAIGGAIFGDKSGLTKTITGGIKSLFGADSVLSKTLSSAVPVIGSLIGPAIAGLQKLFGKSEESAKVSPLRDTFFKAAGGLDVLNPKVLQLTGNLTAVQDVFKAKTVDDFNAAIQRLNAVLGTQDQALADLDAAVKKYGFSIEELGPKFAQQKLNQSQGELLKDWKLLNVAVSDQNALLTKTAASFQDVVSSAQRSGTTISEELRDPIQKLVDMGLLVDANGNKITDLSGLKFGSLDSEFDKLTKAINNLTRALGGAVDEVNDLAKDREFEVRGKVTFDQSQAPDLNGGWNTEFPGDGGDALPSFEKGSKGVRDFGAGTLAVLHGREAVIPEADLKAMNRAAQQAVESSGDVGAVNGGTVIAELHFHGSVLAEREYVEQNLAGPILDAIQRHHLPKFGRLVTQTRS